MAHRNFGRAFSARVDVQYLRTLFEHGVSVNENEVPYYMNIIITLFFVHSVAQYRYQIVPTTSPPD